ncbi:MAG: acylphosphatase [Candidatus Sungiibacteriota bacterium]
MNKRVEIAVKGRVQGVFFREEVKKAARELGLAGWVRNEADDSVKIIAEGKEEKLQKLIAWCRQGSKWSRVEKLEAKWDEYRGEFTQFEIVS